MTHTLALTMVLPPSSSTPESLESPREQVAIQWDFPKVFSLPLLVGSEHIDGLNHTNNAVYVQWCQHLAWAHSEALGLSVEDYQRLNRAMAIRHSEYDYMMASYEGEALLLGTWLTKSEGINMERRFQLVRERDGQTILRGIWRLVCIEISSGKPKRLPPEFVQTYGPIVVSVTDSTSGE